MRKSCMFCNRVAGAVARHDGRVTRMLCEPCFAEKWLPMRKRCFAAVLGGRCSGRVDEAGRIVHDGPCGHHREVSDGVA